MDAQRTETTRYLCAAAYLDSAFRETVIRDVIEEEFKAIGENVGVDLPQVASYALAARHRERMRDSWLMLPWALGLLVLLGFPAALLSSNRLLLFIGAAIAAWMIVFGFLWHDYFRVIMPHLIARRSASGTPQEASAPTGENLSGLSHLQSGNVVVSSGFSPFVGSGDAIGAWSFAVNIATGKEELGSRLNPIPFQISELYDKVHSSLRSLRIPSMTVDRRLYVDGTAIRNDTRFLSNPEARPFSHVDTRLVTTIAERPEDRVRHYLCARIVGWQGEIVVTLFTRAVKLEDKLFIETNYFLLRPISDKYREIDRLPMRSAFSTTVSLLAKSAAHTIVAWPLSPFRLLAAALQPLQRAGRRHRILQLIHEQQNFDYGAATSLREIAGSRAYRRFFELLDKEMYVKITQRQLLETIIAFLDTKHIDTTDFTEQRNTILNNGVIVSGGSITADNLAVGERANAGAASEMAGAVRAAGRAPTGGAPS